MALAVNYLTFGLKETTFLGVVVSHPSPMDGSVSRCRRSGGHFTLWVGAAYAFSS